MAPRRHELETRILASFDELAAVAGEWDALWARCPGATPFQLAAWLLAWVQAFSPACIRALAVRSGGRLVGLAPFLIYPREEERVLAFMGGGVSDYLDVLAEPQQEAAVVAAILAAIREIDGWTTLDLTDLRADSLLRRAIGMAPSTLHDQCSALLLPETRPELLQLLSKRQRANLRCARSRLQRSGGGQVELATGETLPGFLDDLFRLHTRRWSQAGQSGVLAEEALRRFHQEASAQLLRKRILRLYRLRLAAGRTGAVVYSLFGGRTLFCYLQAYDPELAWLSPGTQLTFFAMEDALELGVRKFDFLRGQEAYKRHWCATPEATYRIQLVREQLNARLSAQEIAA